MHLKIILVIVAIVAIVAIVTIVVFTYTKTVNPVGESANEINTNELFLEDIGYATTSVDESLTNSKFMLSVDIRSRSAGTVCSYGEGITIENRRTEASLLVVRIDNGTVTVTRTTTVPEGSTTDSMTSSNQIESEDWHRIVFSITHVSKSMDRWTLSVDSSEEVKDIPQRGVPFKGSNLYLGGNEEYSRFWNGCIRNLTVNSVPKTNFRIYPSKSTLALNKTMLKKCI
jgi:hypothetical protein